jgi:uncharacterized protein
MKRKIFDLGTWDRLERHTAALHREGGYVIYDLHAQAVNRPLDVTFQGRPVRILDHGYRWVRFHPHGAGEGVTGHALTVQLDASGHPVQFYVDLHGGEGVTPSGHPWHDDLYLDLVGALAAEQSGPWRLAAVVLIDTVLIDQDELQEALEAGLVSPLQAQAAYAEAAAVQAALRDGSLAVMQFAQAWLAAHPHPGVQASLHEPGR